MHLILSNKNRKKIKTMHTKRFISSITMLSLTFSLLLASCAPAAQGAENNQAKKLVGSLNAEIATPD